MQAEREINPLTGLRFLAALAVFIFHLQIRWPLVDSHFLTNMVGQGAVGMSIFFMLSGFLLAHRYANGKTSYRDYAINRLARIYPIYVVAALVTLPWFGDHSTAQAIGLVTSNIFLLQAWIPPYFPYWNNGASWSISVEVFCYVLLPLLLVCLQQLTTRRLIYATIAIYIIASIPGIFATFHQTFLDKLIYIWPIFRLPEFTLGACLCLLLTRGVGTQLPRWLPYVALGTLLIYLGIVGNGLALYVGHHWLVLPTIGIWLIILTYGKGGFVRVLGCKPAVWLGKISYCFYSFQPLIILSLISHHDRLITAIPVLANPYALALAASIALLGVATVGYYCIEEPLRARIRTWKK
jgi:peptidoglycan/LPS O-acetylase OafA/YrhL